MANQEFRFILTKKCNYKCNFCHEEGVYGKDIEQLQCSDYGFLFDIGRRNFGWQTVTLTGGEPLVRKDFPEIVKALHSKGAEIVVTTNGSLMKKHLETFASEKDLMFQCTP